MQQNKVISWQEKRGSVRDSEKCNVWTYDSWNKIKIQTAHFVLGHLKSVPFLFSAVYSALNSELPWLFVLKSLWSIAKMEAVLLLHPHCLQVYSPSPSITSLWVFLIHSSLLSPSAASSSSATFSPVHWSLFPSALHIYISCLSPFLSYASCISPVLSWSTTAALPAAFEL